jgi:hypothetical protein
MSLMNVILSKFSAHVILLLLFAVKAAAQTVTPLPSLADPASKGPFVSERSNFVIALPAAPTSVTQTKDVGSRTGGRGTRFTWNLREIDVTVDHVIHPPPVLRTGQHMDEYSKLFKDNVMAVAGGRAKLIKEFSVGMLGISGVAMEFSTGSALIVAYAYTRENEEFIIVGTAKPAFPDSEQMVRNVTGSFRLNKAGVTVNGVTYNMPPGVNDPYTLLSMHKDRLDENLRGMVKSVIVESENALDDPSVRVRRSERYYDSFGNATREILNFANGALMMRRDFNNDYFTNKRSATISTTDDVKNGYLEFTYRHDENGRTIEEKTLNKSGQEVSRITRLFSGDKVTIANYEGWEKPIETNKWTVNEKGNVITDLRVLSMPGISPRSTIHTYKYESFDSQGNWTKRTFSIGDNLVTIEYRDRILR